ncbi:methionine--tRNA ligase, mitochondrial-like [Oppia nitens]|uniref:methionine--tRNA ligase, mitochondrial-like n=1 Tax=Oppia nitens TaxID=1686743 RepID=UPI0023DC41D0|nr:methionine--tRNA ligase, mitochondrial-like [Oppia nitens]
MFSKLMKFNYLMINTISVNTLKCKSNVNYSQYRSQSSMRTSIDVQNDSFITTPIFYVNSVPHIGHLYSAIIADTIHRFNRLLAKGETIFSTGTDEHGIKIQRAAQLNGIETKVFCDQISHEFRSLFKLSDISFTHFVRTTDESHINAVKRFWSTIMNNGFIYKSSYEGWYCCSDETFVSESRTFINEDKVRVSVESGNPVEWSAEDNYIFKLSLFKNSILDWINSGQVFKPPVFGDILKHEVEKDLRDISISRPKSRVNWGIEVPNDSSQVIYVWFDALINYLTVSGYPNNLNHLWPPTCQVIGKDILKFHGIYWPAFLMAAGLDPPKTLLCHSHWLKDDIKMSKSRGNVIDPFESIKTFTSDGFRYFLLRQGSLHTDSNYNELKVKQYLNAELADTYGNLLSRCTSKAINKKQIYPKFSLDDIKLVECESLQLINLTKQLPTICKDYYLSGNFHLVINEIMNCLRMNNNFFNDMKPWLLAKQDNEEYKLQMVLYITLETLRVCSILLQPIVPNLSNQVLNKLNISLTERLWINAEQAFYSNDYMSESIKLKPLSLQKSIIFAKI